MGKDSRSSTVEITIKAPSTSIFVSKSCRLYGVGCLIVSSALFLSSFARRQNHDRPGRISAHHYYSVGKTRPAEKAADYKILL